MKYSYKILSPATFYNNVNINKNCTVKQIIELPEEEKVFHDYISASIEGTKGIGFIYDFELDLSELKPNFTGSIEHIASSAKTIYTRNGILIEKSGTPFGPKINSETKIFTCSVKTGRLSNTDIEALGGEDNIEINVFVNATFDFFGIATDVTPSYSNKTSLFGAGGILRDIENRLNAIHESLKGIGAKDNIYEPKITELNVNKATVQDVILPKEVYDGEKTSLSEILKDIDSRFENVSSATFGELTLTKYGKYITGILPSLTEGEGYESTIESETYKIYSPSQELTFYIYRYKLDHSNNYGNFYNIYRMKYNLTPNTLKITYETVEQSFATSIDFLPSYIKNYTVNIGYIRNN